MKLFDNSSGSQLLLSGTQFSPVQYATFYSGMLGAYIVKNIPVVNTYDNYTVIYNDNFVYAYNLGFQPKFIISVHMFPGSGSDYESGTYPRVIFKHIFMPFNSYFVIRQDSWFNQPYSMTFNRTYAMGVQSCTGVPEYFYSQFFAIHASGVWMAKRLYEAPLKFFIAWR